MNHEKWGRIRLCLRESPESKGMTRYNMKPRKDMSLRGLLPLSWWNPGHFTGRPCQMFREYSAMARSEANTPLPAVFSRAMEAHLSRSR